MKIFSSWCLLPTVATAQLLGFGSTCPTIGIDVVNLDNTWLLDLLVVIHDPNWAMFDDSKEADDAAQQEDLLLDHFACPGHNLNDNILTGINCNDYFDMSDMKERFAGPLAPTSFGVADCDGSDCVANEYVCGGEDEGFAFAGGHYISENLGDLDEESNYKDFGQEYDRITLTPVNTDGCNCADMRISVFIEAFHEEYLEALPDSIFIGGLGYQGSAVWLNSHELASLTEESSVRAPEVFIPAITLNDSGSNDDADAFPFGYWFTYGAIAFENSAVGDHAVLIKFIPDSGSSSSNILALWALLMHNWW